MTESAKAQDLDGAGSAAAIPTGRLESIDFLRGCAAMGVVLLHVALSGACHTHRFGSELSTAQCCRASGRTAVLRDLRLLYPSSMGETTGPGPH